ncbi:MAG: hypothetical protein F7C81_06100 [Desulfurococcales archaeon]|nr:hypothetical protein [Desulfurococcales archaeon]
MTRRALLKPLQVEMLVEASKVMIPACLRLGLQCRDPPLATTGMLYSMGHTQYSIRSLWRALEGFDEKNIPIYKFHDVSFNIKILHIKETVCMINDEGILIPLDKLDSDIIKRRGMHCTYAPRTHSVRLYVTGWISDHVHVYINVVRILVIMAQSDSIDTVNRLLNGVLDVVWNRGYSDLEDELIKIFKLHKYSTVLSVILPYTPREKGDLLKISTIIRRLHALERGNS